MQLNNAARTIPKGRLSTSIEVFVNVPLEGLNTPTVPELRFVAYTDVTVGFITNMNHIR